MSLELSKHIFWDVRYEDIDWEKHAQFVIRRVLRYGQLCDWKKIVKYYGKERMKEELLNVRYLDKVSLSFASFYFNVPKEKFRCYKVQQSMPAHWDF